MSGDSNECAKVVKGGQNKHTGQEWEHSPSRALFSCVAIFLFSINSTSCDSERDSSALSLNLSKMRHFLKDKKVTMMFLRLNADRVPDTKGIKEELLLRELEERRAGQKETKREQA